MKLSDAEPKSIKPGTRIEIVESDNKKGAVGLRGTVTKTLLAELDQDRYDSYCILWDKGSVSWGVFSNWCTNLEILDEIHPWWSNPNNDPEKFDELFDLYCRDKADAENLLKFVGE